MNSIKYKLEKSRGSIFTCRDLTLFEQLKYLIKGYKIIKLNQNYETDKKEMVKENEIKIMKNIRKEMTKEKAIEVLTHLSNYYWCDDFLSDEPYVVFDREFNEAIELAVKVLKEQV
jgi:hypothetical protein